MAARVRARRRLGVALLMMALAIPARSWAQVEREEQATPHEDPDAREQFWRLSHGDVHGDIPPNALVRAKDEMDQMRNAQQLARQQNQRGATPLKVTDAGISGWEWLGPGNIGGRIRAILIDPTNSRTMWIGSVTGGLWRSDDGGTSWGPVNDFMANLAITSIVMDPINNSIMYAATGEGAGGGAGARQGAGIFKSVDHGVTWTQLPFTANANFYWVNRLAHSPTTSGQLLAATSNGVWWTTDGGANWTQSLSANAQDVDFYPGSASLAIAGGNPGAWTSTDGGKNWTPQATGALNKLPGDGARCEVACATNVLQTYYVSMNRNQGEIWRSTDGGTTWTLQNTGNKYLTTQGNYANLLWVDPTNAQVIVVGGLDMRRSSNGGVDLDNISNWQCFPDCLGTIHSAHADQHIMVATPGYNGTTNRLVFVGDDGGIQYTNDIYAAGNGGFGDGWAYSYINLGITQFWGADAAPDGSLFVGGAQDNGEPRLQSLAGPNNWTSMYSFGDGGITLIDPASPNRVYAEYVYLEFKRSDNGGGGYSDKQNGLGDAKNKFLAPFIAPYTMDPTNTAVLYAGGKRIWRTPDHGDNWTQVRDSIPSRAMCSVIAVSPSNPNIIWVGYANGIVSLGTLSGGTWSWTDVGLIDLPSKYVTDIAVNPTSAGEAFVTFSGYDNSNIYYTTNYGGSWGLRRGGGSFAIPAVQINTVTYHPLNTDWIYVGTDLGVLASEDHGLNWKVLPLYGTTEGPANVAVSQLFWQGSQYLCAATFGRGMYRTRVLPNIYVDINNIFGPQDGSDQYPYRQIQDAINAAGPGTTIVIRPGDYPQAPLTFSKRGNVTAPAGGVTIH